MRALLSLSVPISLLFASAVASAQAGLEDQEARGLFLAGQSAFEGGRFEEALEHFERAYTLSERPGLLYNIGTAAERLRREERAIEAFDLFLEREPDTPQRANIEGRMRILRRAVAEREAGDRAAVESQPTAAVAPREEPTNALGWALTAGGLAVAAGGGLSLALAASSSSVAEDVDEGTPWTEVEDDAARVDRRRRAGLALLSIGAALGGVGLIVLASGGDDGDSVALRVGPAHVTVEGSF